MFSKNSFLREGLWKTFFNVLESMAIGTKLLLNMEL